MTVTRNYGNVAGDDVTVDRNFLAKLWVADKKLQRGRRNYQRRSRKSAIDGVESIVEQPPVTQPLSGFLKPTSPEEVQIAPLLARSNLLITRDIEWANLVLGFEQAYLFLSCYACLRYQYICMPLRRTVTQL
jgi:hypothetical protein